MDQITLFLFGYTGNLAKNKILPALSRFKNIKVVGIGRRPMPDLFYIQKDIETQGEEILAEIKKYDGPKIFYLATYPFLYPKVLSLLKGIDNAKVMIEKPIDRNLHFDFDENQIYRVDHYLGKRGLRDLANDKNENIDRIEIVAIENFGIGERGRFYDRVGALLDIGQNHVLQIITACFGVTIPKDRAKVIQNLVPNNNSLVLGQYEGYTSETDVNPDSKTDTFFKFSARYNNISVKVAAGKNLNETKTEVVIYFKDGVKKTYPIYEGEKSAYENLIGEAIKGNQAYFVSDPEVKASWDFIDKLSANRPDPVIYKISSLPNDIG